MHRHAAKPAKTAVSHPALSLEWLKPIATVFVSSAAIMMIELVAGRIIARHLGASVYTWTSVIGIVLAGIAVGNYIGGIIADKWANTRTLSLMFMCGSIMSGLISVFDRFADDLSFLWTLSWPMRVATHVGIVFFLPTAFLGTISPVIVKMALDLGRERGRTIGDIYAWGVVGSLVGTFLAGFFMIAALGSSGVVWLVACILALMAILYNKTSKPALGWGVLSLVLAVLATSETEKLRLAGELLMLRPVRSPAVIYSTESNYSYIEIVKLSKEKDFRGMHLDTLMHSQIEMDHPADFRYEYERVYAAITKRLRPSATKIDSLTIGGGGYVYPRFMNTRWPEGRTDVVEIDPEVTEAAMAAFGLPRDTTINCFHEDGRVFIDRMLDAKKSGKPYPMYDFIYCDAVNDYSVPYQLTTLEYMKKVHELIRPDGAYLMNMIDIYETEDGKGGLFLGSIITTMKQVFPYVNVFAEGQRLTNEDGTPNKPIRALRSTYIVSGTNQPFDTSNLGPLFAPDCKIFAASETDIQNVQQRAGQLVLTDAYAPVENLLADVVKDSAIHKAIEEWNVRAKRELADGDAPKALAIAQHALEMFPDLNMSFRLQETLGNALLECKRYQEAVDAYAKLFKLNANYEAALSGSAQAYQGMGQDEKALPFLAKFAELHPEDANMIYNYGITLLQAKRYPEAAKAFKDAAAINPNFCDAYNNMGVAYSQNSEPRSAMAAFRKALDCDPTMEGARRNIDAILGFDSREAEDKLEQLEAQASASPGDPSIAKSVADAYYSLRQAEGALKWYDKVIELTPENAEAHLRRANVLVELGRLTDAKAGYRKVLELQPGLDTAIQSIERIEAFELRTATQPAN